MKIFGVFISRSLVVFFIVIICIGTLSSVVYEFLYQKSLEKAEIAYTIHNAEKKLNSSVIVVESKKYKRKYLKAFRANSINRNLNFPTSVLPEGKKVLVLSKGDSTRLTKIAVRGLKLYNGRITGLRNYWIWYEFLTDSTTTVEDSVSIGRMNKTDNLKSLK